MSESNVAYKAQPNDGSGDMKLTPPQKSDKLTTNTVSLKPIDWDLLDKLGKDRGTNRSEALRAILDAYRDSQTTKR